MKFHCRLTAFLRSSYLINLNQYSPAIPTLRRQKNNLNCPPFFRNFNPTRRELRENLSNRSSGIQIPRDICTFAKYKNTPVLISIGFDDYYSWFTT